MLSCSNAAASGSSSGLIFMGRSFLGESWLCENSHRSRLERPALYHHQIKEA